MFRNAFLMSVTLLALAACGRVAPPNLTPARPTPNPPLSTIAATFTLPENQIAQILNDRTKDHIADLHGQPVKCGIGTCHLDLLAQRTGPILAGGSGNSLELHLPFNTNAQLSAPGFLSRLHAQADARGDAVAHTELGLGQNWQLHSVTHGEVWLESSHLRIGPLTTNLSEIWNGNQSILSRPLWQTMDKQIAALPIKLQVARLWTRLFLCRSRSARSPSPGCCCGQSGWVSPSLRSATAK